MSACSFTSLAGRFFFLASCVLCNFLAYANGRRMKYGYMFVCLKSLGNVRKCLCLYVWNPWEMSGSVCYRYVKICQKKFSSIWCTTPEKQFTTSTKQDSNIKCSTNLNAVPRSCSIRKLMNFFNHCAWTMINALSIFLAQFFQGKTMWLSD